MEAMEEQSCFQQPHLEKRENDCVEEAELAISTGNWGFESHPRHHYGLENRKIK